MSETRDDRAVEELVLAAEKALDGVTPLSAVALWLDKSGRVIVELVHYLRVTE